MTPRDEFLHHLHDVARLYPDLPPAQIVDVVHTFLSDMKEVAEKAA